jgi:ribosomal protein L32
MPIIVIFCSFLLFYLFLFYFVYRGYRWAIIVIIIIFTLETLLKEIEALETLNRVRLFPILWWLIVMPVLYRALTVENERRRLKKQDTNNTKFQITKNKVIFCQNCGKKNITPANYCKKCGNKIVK